MNLSHAQLALFDCALGTAALACYTDLRTRCIPNRLTGPMMLCGLALQVYSRGGLGGLDAMAGLLLCGATFLIFHVAGGMGAGDVKLIAAEGCLLGAHRSVLLLLGTAIAGGLFATALAARKRCLRQTLGNAAALARHHQRNGLEPHPELNLANRSALRLPYALAIATGVLITISSEFLTRWPS